MKDVFISYKTEDIDEANWVKSTLETNGISCWMAPSCIPGGSSYAAEIPQAIRKSKVFVLILSSKAQSSQWVSKEVDLAINEGKVVLPFMLENCALKDDFNFYLTNVQRYEAYENKAAAVEKMLKEIKALTEHSNLPELEQAKPEMSVMKFEQPKQSKKKVSIVCVLSMVFGIVSLLALYGCFIIPNIVAIVLAIVGAGKINKEAVEGRGFAIAGLILGIVGNAIGLSVMFAVIGFIIALVAAVISVVLFIVKLKRV